MNGPYRAIPAIILFVLVLVAIREVYRRSGKRTADRDARAGETSADLQISVARRGLATRVEVSNPSKAATARDVRVFLDTIPAIDHPERVRSNCPPFADLSPGQIWAAMFIFTRTRPGSVIVKWTDPGDRRSESSQRL